LYYENDDLNAVIEIKTTKRVEDWVNGAPTTTLYRVLNMLT